MQPFIILKLRFQFLLYFLRISKNSFFFQVGAMLNVRKMVLEAGFQWALQKKLNQAMSGPRTLNNDTHS